MRLYYSIEEMESEKKLYGTIALSTKVKVDFTLQSQKYTLIPYTVGDVTVLVEISDEKEVFDLLLKEYVKDSLLNTFIYSDEIKEISKHFKTELKNFKILVVKYSSVEEKEFSRYSLSNITFGVVAYNGLDIHLIPSNVKVREKEGYCVSDVVTTPEEGIRQSLLLAKWFGKGAYTDLPKLAHESGKYDDMIKWKDFIKYILVSNFDNEYFGGIIKKLNEFRKETYFNPLNRIEMVALGIILTKLGGGYIESDSYDII
ncbi:MAG: DUF4940 domain-containing protein [Fervidobacterium sp.]|uniref:DUF4940 domain-containing protein n=1 Tax=Fervidobacterium TaxID=2422 RepID=UPI0030971457